MHSMFRGLITALVILGTVVIFWGLASRPLKNQEDFSVDKVARNPSKPPAGADARISPTAGNLDRFRSLRESISPPLTISRAQIESTFEGERQLMKKSDSRWQRITNNPTFDHALFERIETILEPYAIPLPRLNAI